MVISGEGLLVSLIAVIVFGCMVVMILDTPPSSKRSKPAKAVKTRKMKL